jgi:hypothetical protein
MQHRNCNDSPVEKLLEAVLYEGFILYPYRPSVKNTERWTFGGLYPPAFSQAQQSVESPMMQTQCLILGDGETLVETAVRFLRLIDRKVGRFAAPLSAWPADDDLVFAPVDSLTVGDRKFFSWQEAAEQKIMLDSVTLAELLGAPRKKSFAFPQSTVREPIPRSDGQYVGVLERRQCSLAGSVDLSAEQVAEGCVRVMLRSVNETTLEASAPLDRREACLRSFVAAHAIIRVAGGELISQIDPPERWRAAVAANQNIGTWPVLIGERPDRTTMLAAPIILYDYPQIAPESPGGLFDSTEIDEVLTLRIMTLTEAEKQTMRTIDPRSRDLLDRVESIAPEALLALHGTTRDLN